jgi:hypothetical protein
MISHVMSAPQFVMWEHGGRVVPGKTIHVSKKHDIVTKSVLRIDKVTADSGGMYYCMPDNISPAAINISIVKTLEEHMAVINAGVSNQLFIVLILCNGLVSFRFNSSNSNKY